jgi:hypothetical protein
MSKELNTVKFYIKRFGDCRDCRGELTLPIRFPVSDLYNFEPIVAKTVFYDAILNSMVRGFHQRCIYTLYLAYPVIRKMQMQC